MSNQGVQYQSVAVDGSSSVLKTQLVEVYNALFLRLV